MSEVVEILRDIRDELREIRLLYRVLVDKLILVEEPSEEERKAVEEKDEVAGEEEFLRAFGNVHNRDIEESSDKPPFR